MKFNFKNASKDVVTNVIGGAGGTAIVMATNFALSKVPSTVTVPDIARQLAPIGANLLLAAVLPMASKKLANSKEVKAAFAGSTAISVHEAIKGFLKDSNPSLFIAGFPFDSVAGVRSYPDYGRMQSGPETESPTA